MLRLELKVAAVGESVTVVAEPSRVTLSPAVGTVVDRQFVAHLPLNGRSFQSLITLTPGVVVTKAGNPDGGQFSVNGQRPDANYFMVDGVSANVGTRGSSLGQSAGGSIPAFSAYGGTSNLVSVDAMQEFRVQTSSYAPEFGRSPGAQVSIVTRSGTNQLHGVEFEYFRHDALDATDWFVNRDHLAKPALRQNQFGGVLGGPLIKDRTFYFASYEGLRLQLPQSLSVDVPSMTSRQQASPAMQPFLAVYPIPNGPDTTNGLARFSASYSDPSTSDATSLRIDHTFSPRLTVFGRYNYAPSSVSARALNGIYTPSIITPTNNKTSTATLGSTWTINERSVNELRVNWTRNTSATIFEQDTFGGAQPIADALAFPTGATRTDALMAFQVAGVANGWWAIGRNVANVNTQVNIVDTLTWVLGAHQVKVSADVRTLTPRYGTSPYQESIGFSNFAGAIAGRPSSVTVSSRAAASLDDRNLSLFAQDDWRAGQRLNRLSDTPGRETIVRGGAGVFYDLGTGNVGGNVGNLLLQYPLALNKFLSPVPSFPASAATLAAPTAGVPPYAAYGFDPALKTPRTYHWNVAIERALGRAQAVTLTYLGAAGHDLLRQEFNMSVNPTISTLVLNYNAAKSDYKGVQIEFRRRPSHGLQGLASYAWGQSFDNVSGDSVQLLTPSARLDPMLDWGPSDFDVRHSFAAGFTYEMPAPSRNTAVKTVLGGWSLNGIVHARSATPVNITITRNLGFGSFPFRPDIVAGVPFYTDDSNAPGGMRFNKDAFVVPTNLRQGTLGRNALRGFSVSKTDLGIQRRFRLINQTTLRVRAEFFNLFNTPHFADPISSLTSGLFGVSTQMLSRSLGAGGVSGGLSPLYQIGGPRSVQLSLRVEY